MMGRERGRASSALSRVILQRRKAVETATHVTPMLVSDPLPRSWFLVEEWDEKWCVGGCETRRRVARAKGYKRAGGWAARDRLAIKLFLYALFTVVLLAVLLQDPRSRRLGVDHQTASSPSSSQALSSCSRSSCC